MDNFLHETYIPVDEIFYRLLAALLCGLMIGLDREFKQKPAGVRTYILVCLGSCAFTMIIFEVTEYYLKNYDENISDPTRVIQGLITGIGFLGGSAIINSSSEQVVKNLATGASIWVSGAIGLACGYGFYIYAVILTLVVLSVLTVLGFLRVCVRNDIESEKDDYRSD